jgi:hypothetical protein
MKRGKRWQLQVPANTFFLADGGFPAEVPLLIPYQAQEAEGNEEMLEANDQQRACRSSGHEINLAGRRNNKPNNMFLFFFSNKTSSFLLSHLSNQTSRTNIHLHLCHPG